MEQQLLAQSCPSGGKLCVGMCWCVLPACQSNVPMLCQSTVPCRIHFSVLPFTRSTPNTVSYSLLGCAINSNSSTTESEPKCLHAYLIPPHTKQHDVLYSWFGFRSRIFQQYSPSFRSYKNLYHLCWLGVCASVTKKKMRRALAKSRTLAHKFCCSCTLPVTYVRRLLLKFILRHLVS